MDSGGFRSFLSPSAKPQTTTVILAPYKAFENDVRSVKTSVTASANCTMRNFFLSVGSLTLLMLRAQLNLADKYFNT